MPDFLFPTAQLMQISVSLHYKTVTTCCGYYWFKECYPFKIFSGGTSEVYSSIHTISMLFPVMNTYSNQQRNKSSSRNATSTGPHLLIQLSSMPSWLSTSSVRFWDTRSSMIMNYICRLGRVYVGRVHSHNLCILGQYMVMSLCIMPSCTGLQSTWDLGSLEM